MRTANKRRLRSPVVWFGGKGNMVAKLLPLFPEHKIYVEPFGGGASLLFAKEPSAVEVYNDLDDGLVTLFRVLRDPDKFGRFYHYAINTPYSRSEWKECRNWQDYPDDVVRAWRWFILIRQSFAGLRHSWGRSVTTSHRGMAETASSWLSALEMIPEIHRRLMRVQIEQKDFRAILKEYDTPETLFYCDPPYVLETRKDGRYIHEMTEDDHRELVEILLGLQGKVIFSGYVHPVYDALVEAGWERKDFQIFCAVAGHTRTGKKIPGEAMKRVESVWMSPSCNRP
jgi:DNA adenine methylase